MWKMSERTTVGGIPVECLTGEPAAIWSGWRTLGDRELVREASAKGTHINLAYKCLAYRRNCSVDQAQSYFNKEVETWVKELLTERQIFRASHILRNMGKNPLEYILKVCTKCKDVLQRTHLAEYIASNNSFDDAHLEAWNIIKCIQQYEKKHKIQDGLSFNVSIEDVINLPEDIKHAMCTELYFYTFDSSILNHVTNATVWGYLLVNNKINEIQLWIDMYYNGSLTQDYEVAEDVKSFLSDLTISSEMIESIELTSASDLTKDLIRNFLCRYGVFEKKEQTDTKLILRRFFHNAFALKDIDTILSCDSCNIDKKEFLENIDRELCLVHCQQTDHSEENSLEIMKLLEVLTNMCEASENFEDALIDGTLETIRFFTKDLDDYAKQNYLIVLALIFAQLRKMRNKKIKENNGRSAEDNTLKDLFTNPEGIMIGNCTISHEVLQHTLRQVPFLRDIIENQTKKDDITMYELLDGYKNLNVKQLFKWRFKNESMPDFSDKNLVKKYGYTETLTYGYYLKEARPNMAIHSLKCVQGKLLRNISQQRKSKAALYAHLFALKNLSKPEIVCSCISFIEMLGIDSESLRLHVTAAHYVQRELNVSIGDILESVVYRNQKDLISVMSYLEMAFQKLFMTEHLCDDDTEFITALKMWDVIVRFARVHNTMLPDSLLKFLATRNLWFEFALVIHLFAYPTGQVLQCATHFKNPNIREHFCTCLNNTQLEKLYLSEGNEQKLKSRDTRQSLYYNIGLKQIESPASSSSSSGEASYSDSYSNTSTLVPTNYDIFSSHGDLWLTILKCHQSQDPPGALIGASRITLKPVLTVLATCYEPSSTAAYCYTWMVISTANQDILSEYAECLEQQIWPAGRVLELLGGMVMCGYTSTLNRAYKIFVPESPFNPFFEFLQQCTSRGEFKECQKDLLDFKSQCTALKCNKIMNWDYSDATYMRNLYWVATVAVRCVITALGYRFRSTRSQIKFLDALVKCNFHVDLPVQILNLQCFLDVARTLLKTDVKFNFTSYSFTDGVYNFDKEIQRCIGDLMSTENYSVALEISNIAGLDASEVILAQYRNEFQQSIHQNNEVESSFWRRCAIDFEKYKVRSEKAAEFFVEHAEKVVLHKERYEILRLAFETLKNIETEQQTIDTLEMAMWKSCMLAGPENIELSYDDKIFNKLKTELLFGLKKLQVSCVLADELERNSAKILIDKLIDLGKLDIALRISVIFNCKHRDLQILMLCLSLAEGEISVAELTTQQRSLLSEATKSRQTYNTIRKRGLQRLPSSSSLNINSHLSGEANKLDAKNLSTSQLQAECLLVLDKLLALLEHGIDICLRIVLCYKLAERLGRSYQSLLILADPMRLLQEIIETNIDNKFETANDIITAYKINSSNIATFLAQNITLNITRGIEDGHEDSALMWGYSLQGNFHLIMELCTDVSLLGLELLGTAHRLLGHSCGEKRNVTTLKIIVELLIRSHDCFTACCNMEGIASVLRKCQNLANTLQNLKHWNILVRLVTGVGRFTEMNYVFQILKENHQFEFLLRKGLDKVPGLKMALLEFLKRHCPEDKDLFVMVALHFRLYDEIAIMWENEAKNVIKELISDVTKDCGKLPSPAVTEIKLPKTEHVQKRLQLALSNYLYAFHQYYFQDNEKKLKPAVQCQGQAQLVTLQISLLNAISNNQQTVCLLNMKNEDIDKVLYHVLPLNQALVVIQAYNHHVDWANLIYNRCILNGEAEYLKDFLTMEKPSSALVQDCVRRYRLEKNITHVMRENMKILISKLPDVECKYTLASQLGFKSIVQDLIEQPTVSAYLKDTVWKKGYNAM